MLVIAIVYVNIRSTDSGNNLVDLNEPVPNVASEDTNKVASNENSNQQNSSVSNNNSKTSNGQGDTNDSGTDLSLLENDIVSEPTKENSTTQEASNSSDKKTTTQEATKEESQEDEALEAMSSEAKKLSFKEEDGLLWPVSGDVLLNYSMDHGVYFATLGQYKCNPAILIGAEVGTKVVSAAKGIVTAIENDDETGLTITMDIGSDYTLIYGQLADAKVEVGDSIKAGDVLATVAEPSKYYIVEGSNLYFEVINDKEPVNPMLLLK